MAGLGTHRDQGDEPRSKALCEKLPACASPLLLSAQQIEPYTGRPSRTWHSFNVCVHLIREDERIGAG